MFFKELVKSGIEDIRFWRTQDKKEIDFIVNNSHAFEIKSNPASFKKNKYKDFTKNYPDIKLNLVTLKDQTCLAILDFVS